MLRTRELLEGLWLVGITNYPIISDFPDRYVDSLEAAEKFYGLENSIAFQVMLLRRFKPEVVLGHDLNGEYGHGAHMLNAKTLTIALNMAMEGYKLHVSQQHFKFLVRIEGPNDCRKFGLYKTAVGPDIIKNDFFENIPIPTLTIAPTSTPIPTPTQFVATNTPIPEKTDTTISLLGRWAIILALVFIMAIMIWVGLTKILSRKVV